MSTLTITAAGMVTSVGFNAPATCAALRAGIRVVNETNLWDGESGTFLAAGKVSLPHWWVGLGKLAELAAPAIHECFEAAKPTRPEAIPVLVGVAAFNRPFRFQSLDSEILGEIAHRLGFELHPDSRVIAGDHVSAVQALQVAAQLIEAGKAPCVIVAAVDSLLDQRLVTHYLAHQRLLTPKYSNGFSPGEAAAAVLVNAAGEHAQGQLRILGVGYAHETATIESDAPLRADGLTSAIREALLEAGCTIQEVQYRITDLNGEHYKFKEMTLAMMRFERKPKPRLFELWHPIEFIGDVGAAIGPLLLGWALHAGQKGYGVGRRALCTLGNDDGERAALVVDYETGTRG